MASRALAFSDPELISLASREFIPVAENCSYLQRQEDARGEFFRLVAEQGHYAGRTQPSATRQGIYACTADGHLLASINTREAEKMLAMMRQALDRWREPPPPQPDALTNPSDLSDPSDRPDPRYHREYPTGGLVLKVYARDLPRRSDTRPEDWRRNAINYDHAWFTREEARSLVPEEPRVGASYPVPPGVVRRLARFHLLDNVRGETPMWREEEVCRAEMTIEITDVADEAVEMRLRGAVRNAGRGAWAVRPFREVHENSERGFDCRLAGWLRYDRRRERFERFDVIAAGLRWGGSEHNCRWDDLEPAPMAVAFELTGDSPRDRTPPQGGGAAYWGVVRSRI